jgi:flagellar hook-associated protein 3 FlgL
MRISSAQIYQLAVQAMLEQQARLSKTQNQVATGKRVQVPSDDPVAAVQINSLAQAQSQNAQFTKNSSAATGRLQLEEQAISDSTSVLQRVRELVLQANNATLSDSDRQSIATEIRARQDELLAIANRKDAGGEYLFAGLSGGTQPFVRNGSGVVQYRGDEGARAIQVDASLSVQDSDPGSHVYMDVPAGNGVFTVAATGTNTGNGVLDAGSVVNRAQWVPDNYTISFAAGGAWTVTDSLGNTVNTGTYAGATGSVIDFRGVQVGITGTPAPGDSFTVAKAGTQDIFSSLDGIVAALQAGASGDAQRAQFNTRMNTSLQQLDQATDRLTTTRSQLGARLAMLDDTDNARANALLDLKGESAQLTDLDYASAVTQMSQQLLGLQAAQQAFTSTSKLSLFNYL